MASTPRLEDAPDVLTADEARAFLHIGRRQMYAALRTGEIPGRRIGAKWIVYRESLLQWLTDRPAVEHAAETRPSVIHGGRKP